MVDRVLAAWDENDKQEQEPGFKRKGYMGHLTRIANVMVIDFGVYRAVFKNGICPDFTHPPAKSV